MPEIPDGKPPLLRLFELFGCTFRLNGSGQAVAEGCPFCGNGKFYLDPHEGTYKCHSENTCGAKGNAYTFIRRVHETSLGETTDDLYRRLKEKRDLPLQTFKRHELAWNGLLGCWLVPFKSDKGEVLNLQRYYPDTGGKFALPGLLLRLYGLDTLSRDPKRTVLLFEGPWDAIAGDHHFLEKKTRNRFDLLAVPSANVFRKEWFAFLKGQTFRLCFDNDEAGRKGQERIAKLAREHKADVKLYALAWPTGEPEGCDVGDLVRRGVNIAEFTRTHCVPVAEPGRRIALTRGDEIAAEMVEWLWAGHIPFGTLVSLSGVMGTHKSGIARDLAARATAGLPMPLCERGLPPFPVLYFTSEDSASRVRDLVRVHGGDLARLHVHDIATGGGEPIDVLECLEEMEALIKEKRARLVILDALNSFVGGDISTDSKARRTLSGRLQALARRTGACLVGVRNWGRGEGGTASQKSLGATSLSDVARCVLNTQELPPIDRKDKTEPRRYLLEFEKVSDAPRPEPVEYSVVSKSTGEADSHLRQIVWRKPVTEEEFRAWWEKHKAEEPGA